MTATEYVVLVDHEDREVGLAEKIQAHEKCLLHRAFSIFIFSDSPEPELLLQQRALHKYHSPLAWTNTCCSHPRQGEDILTAGKRRLQEELGLSAELTDLGWFHYTAHFDNGLSENEIDHVLIGFIAKDQPLHPNPDEVNAFRWITLKALDAELRAQPEQFTPWFTQALALIDRETLA